MNEPHHQFAVAQSEQKSSNKQLHPELAKLGSKLYLSYQILLCFAACRLSGLS